MTASRHETEASDYLALFSQYRGDSGALDFGRAYLEPEDERYRLLFDQVYRLLVNASPFTLAMPQEFRRTARLYLNGDAHAVARMRTADATALDMAATLECLALLRHPR
jgi:hypothetical protein